MGLYWGVGGGVGCRGMHGTVWGLHGAVWAVVDCMGL